jgi:hypothetical protein
LACAEEVVMFTCRFLLRNVISTITLLSTFVGYQTALAGNEMDETTTTVVFTSSCDGATIVSSKDISNIVVVLGKDNFQEFSEGTDFDEGLTKVTLAPDAGFEGMIETVYVNAGGKRSGEVQGLTDIQGEPFHCGQRA